MHLEIDPNNQLLARMSRRRLTGEQLRDQALAVSGALHPELRRLNLTNNQIGMEEILAWELPEQLEILYLYDNPLSGSERKQWKEKHPRLRIEAEDLAEAFIQHLTSLDSIAE